MNIVFTLQEMKDALVAAGYQLKEMEVEIESPFKGTPSRFINTTNVFKDGKEVCWWGYKRVEYAFDILLKERLLGLVSLPEIREIKEIPADLQVPRLTEEYYQYKPL